MSYYQGQDLTFDPLIKQSVQGKALPPSDVPLNAPGGLNPYLIPDGLSMNVRLKYLPYRSYPMQIRLLDTYRRQALAGLWQPRWYTAPQDPSNVISAGDTLNYRLRVAQGSIMWGYNLAVLPSTSGPASTISDVRVTLTDENSGELLIAQYEIGISMQANFTAGTPRAGFGFVMPPDLIRVSAGGDLLVDIVNVVANDRQVQLLMMFLEPAGSPQ